MRDSIICRFECKEHLDEFNKINNLELTKDVKEFHVENKVYKYKKIKSVQKEKVKEYWEEHWANMPEYVSKKQEPYAKIDFFLDGHDLDFANNFFAQSITDKTTSVWFPKLVQGKHSNIRVICGDSNTKYPIYVVSKNRSDKCYTSKFLTQMETPHYVVVEPFEVQKYKNTVEGAYCKVLEMDLSYKKSYDCFSNMGNTESTGPGAVRNFCWEHSIKNGYEWHWVMDDNALEGFHYMNRNKKQKCRTGEIFKHCENFVDRYENIAIAGLNYSMFCKMQDKTPAFVLNTRIYSFLLIRNDIPYRWRGRYNEDTDLSLRALKDGWCTVQFNAFLAGKCTTQKIKGGNTEEFYANEGTLNKSKMLEEMHPDVARVVWKFGRWHHHVDYSIFNQKLRRKEGLVVSNKNNMRFIETVGENTNDTKSYLEKKYNFRNIICLGECALKDCKSLLEKLNNNNIEIYCQENSCWHKYASEDYLLIPRQLKTKNLKTNYDLILIGDNFDEKIQPFLVNAKTIVRI